jgi:hypothetical protein
MDDIEIARIINTGTAWEKYPGIAPVFKTRKPGHKVWVSFLDWMRINGEVLTCSVLKRALDPLTRVKGDEFAAFCDEIVQRYGNNKTVFPNGCPRKVG